MSSPIAPSHIADDVNNNFSYWLYTADTPKTTDAMKNIAKLNNFDFVNDIDINVLDTNQIELKRAIQNIEPSSTSVIFLVYDKIVSILYYDPTNGDDGYLALGDGDSALQFGASAPPMEAPSEITTKFAIFIKQNSDKTTKFHMLENQIKNNIVTAQNQNKALVYMYVFLVMISILSLLFNFDKVQLSHIGFLIFFIGYGVFYKHISTFIVMQFKSVATSLKSADSASQLLQYIKLVVLTTFAFFVPLLSLMLFNTTYDVPLSDATDYTKSLIDGAVDYGSGLIDNSREIVNDGVGSLSQNVGNVQNTVNDAVGSVSNTVSNIGETVSSSVNTISEQVSDGLSRVTPAPSAPSAPSTTPAAAPAAPANN